MAKAKATPKPKTQEEKAMIEDPKKAQELFGQVTGKAVETMTVWADANQRVLREVVELGAATAKEGVRLFRSEGPGVVRPGDGQGGRNDDGVGGRQPARAARGGRARRRDGEGRRTALPI